MRCCQRLRNGIDAMELAGCKIRRMSPSDGAGSFCCGDDDLDDFIRNDAPLYARQKLASNYVMQKDNDTIAYFSLANDRVSVDNFDERTQFNRFRKKLFVNSKRLKGYPSVKLCRFAVDRQFKGCGIGTALLNLIKHTLANNMKSACRFLIVDAYPDAVPFYEKNGFVPLNSVAAQSKSTVLMYFDLCDCQDSVS